MTRTISNGRITLAVYNIISANFFILFFTTRKPAANTATPPREKEAIDTGAASAVGKLDFAV